jgi:hypothetical protein
MQLSCCYGREITEGSNGLVINAELQKAQRAFLGENLFSNYLKD